MNDERGSPEFGQNDKRQFNRKILWLLVALSPNGFAIGIGFFTPLTSGLWNGLWLLYFLIGLNAVLSVAASVGLVRGMRDKPLQFLARLLLAIFFFALNLLIAFFVGCTPMGRIAP